jgi:hypothetical protein
LWNNPWRILQGSTIRRKSCSSHSSFWYIILWNLWAILTNSCLDYSLIVLFIWNWFIIECTVECPDAVTTLPIDLVREGIRIYDDSTSPTNTNSNFSCCILMRIQMTKLNFFITGYRSDDEFNTQKSLNTFSSIVASVWYFCTRFRL